MIVWGGNEGSFPYSNVGGLYDPSTDSWTPTTTTGAPQGRIYHTAVWTGSRMIVWGGYVAGAANTGGLYDPLTDAWAPTTTTGAPAGRFDRHTAVWTGSRMIIWGGSTDGSSSSLNTGGQYNPGNDSWTATSTTGAPAARNWHTAVWTGTRMIVWGGSSPTITNTGGLYDPSSNSWTSTTLTDAPSARNHHTAVWTGSRMVVWGGSDSNTGGQWLALFSYIKN